MRKFALLCVLFGVSCAQVNEGPAEYDVIVVSDALQTSADAFNVDLRKVDTAYYVDSTVERARVEVTCPDGFQMSYDEWIQNRLGMPNVIELVTANSALEQFLPEIYESVSSSIRPKCRTKCEFAHGSYECTCIPD